MGSNIASSLVASDATLKDAVTDISCCRWSRAVGSWKTLIEQRRFPQISAIIASDSGLRCGEVELVQQHLAAVERLTNGTEYFANTLAQFRTLVARRAGVDFPQAFQHLGAQQLRTLGRSAISCHRWSYAIQVWHAYLVRDTSATHFEAYKRLAICHAALGDHEQAITNFEIALGLYRDEQLIFKLDRSRRLEQRQRDAFHKHATRLATGAISTAVREALPRLSRADPKTAGEVVEELKAFGAALNSDMLGGAAMLVRAASAVAPVVEERPRPSRSPALDFAIREIPLGGAPTGDIPARSAVPASVRPASTLAHAVVGDKVASDATAGAVGRSDKSRSGDTDRIAKRARGAPRPFVAGKLDTAIVQRLPLIAAKEIRPVMGDVDFPPPTDEIVNLLARGGFDTVMFVVNGFVNDPRVLKTAVAVTGFGRRLLAIGIQANDGPLAYSLDRLPDGTPLILLPNLNRSINLAMRARKLPTFERAPRHELWLTCMGISLGSILERIPTESRPVLHTHDYHGVFVGGVALEASGQRQYFRWLHDAHEYIRQYDIIDPGLQAAGIAWEEKYVQSIDHLCTVSEELAARLQEAYGLSRLPTVIYNSNSLASRYKYRGPTAKQKLGIEGKRLLVHSGTVTKGRGVEHVVKALPQIPDAVLLLITESKNATTEEIERLAGELGVADRILYHPFLAHDEVMGFVADADAGLITPDRYGNADVGLANKLFDYILACVPVVSSDTDAMRRFITEWSVGELFEAGNASSLASAISAVLGNADAYKHAIRSRVDRQLAVTWEAQIVRLRSAYDELAALGDRAA